MKGTSIVILKKNGNVSNKKFTYNGDIIESLYLIADKRIKMNHKPVKLYSYTTSITRLEIYGYIDGKAGQENSHDLPPNATCYYENFDKSDTDLLFGDAYAIKYKDEDMQDLEIEEYANYYSKLCGGFEDLGDTDGEVSEDEEPTPEDEDFIVPDDEELSTDEEWAPEDCPPEPEETDSESDNEDVDETELEYLENNNE